MTCPDRIARPLAALIAVSLAWLPAPAALAGDPCADCACPTDIDRDGQIGFAEVLRIIADWGPCPDRAQETGGPAVGGLDGGDPCGDCPCPPDVNRDGLVGQADILAVLVTWGPCAFENDCTEPGVCPNFVFGCNGNPDCTCLELFDGSFVCRGEWSCGIDCLDGICPPGYHCVINSCCEAPSCAPDSTLCAPLGGCCIAGNCVEALTENQCRSMAGLFLGLGVDCAGVDCGRGACCRLDAACTQTVEPICAAEGGTFLGEASSCLSCVGACCLDDGSCLDGVSVPACDASGGSFAGFDLVCGDVNCPAGACCLTDAMCEIRTEEACAALGGFFQGLDTVCGDCRFGACCLGEGVCVQAVEEACVEMDGNYRGVATECFFCTIGGCCFLDGSCENTNEEICGASDGVFQGELVFCQDIECPASSACCFVADPCQNLLPDDCATAGGFSVPNLLCNQTQCPELGACCVNGQFCRDAVTEERCEQFNGEYFGPGSVCEGEECSIVIIGACCLSGTEYCIDGLTEGQCIAMGGFYPGDGTMCEMAPCD